MHFRTDDKPILKFAGTETSSSTSSLSSLRTTCIITNFNYGNFVGDAVRSALEQSRSFDEILVIDDGSTDDSLRILQDGFDDEPAVRVISKSNGGQLSSFHRGTEAATGELLFFLDADDRFDPAYCGTVCQLYQERPSVDFVTVGYELFGPASAGSLSCTKPTRDWGVSALAAILNRTWIGNPTSCISMRADLVSRILPYPREENWRIRADDVLVFGASIAGGHKMHLGEKLVHYRVHGSNHFVCRDRSRVEQMQYALEVNRMIQWYVDRFGYDRQGLTNLIPLEFRTISRPTFRDWLRYSNMLCHSAMPLQHRLGSMLKMAQQTFRSARGGVTEASSPLRSPPAIQRQDRELVPLRRSSEDRGLRVV